MKSKKYLIAKIVVLVALAFASVHFARATGSASINLSPTSGQYKVGQTFNVTINVNPGSEKIDMVRTKLTFSPDYLEVKSFSTTPTFSFQAGGNGFDNVTGTISEGAGVPGGITTPTNFGTIAFVVKKAGSAQVAISQDSLALSAGVNKFNGQTNAASFTLSAPAAPPAVKKIKPVATVNSAPVVQTTLENSVVDTQILQKAQPKSFAGSLMNSLSFAMALRIFAFAAAVIILILMGMMFYRSVNKKAKIKIQK